MIYNILQLLEFANGDTKNIQIAQGKNYLPQNFKQAFKTIKNEIKWEKK